MGAIITTSICLSDIDKSKIVKGKNGKKYISITHSVNEETNQYGNNVSSYISQTQEERESKVDRIFVGNGRVVYVNGQVTTATRQDKPTPAPSITDDNDDLPF